MPRSSNHVPNSSRTVGLVAAAATAAAVIALWVRHRASRAERDNPPVGRFVEVEGARLHYIDKGEGPPVVLLHGNTVLLQDFIASGLIDRLAERHRVIAFDRPGFGYSERPRGRLWTAQTQAEAIRHALARLGVDAPVVLGHSWGTLVALGMALGGAPYVRGLLLVSGYYYPTARLDVALTAPAALPVVGDVLRYTVSPLTGRPLLKRTVAAMFSPSPVPDNFFDVIAPEMMLRPSQIRAEAGDAARMIPAAARLRDDYSALRIPVSIFAGADDKIVDPQAQSVRLHQAVPHSSLVVIPGAGHMVHYAAADQIVADIDRLTQRQYAEGDGGDIADGVTPLGSKIHATAG
jgi:pimeloyl-ACP methyl ester carboxylesterase